MKTCELVLSVFRRNNLTVKQLTISEFIGPLSLESCTDQETHGKHVDFTDFITGDDKIIKALNAADQEDGDGGGKKEKKAKGKGKKGK